MVAAALSAPAGSSARGHRAVNNQFVLRGQAFGGYIKASSGRNLAYQLVVNNVVIDQFFEDIVDVFQDEGTISAILWRDL